MGRHHPELRRIVVSLAPAVVVTHAYDGGHPDHDALEFAAYHLRLSGLPFRHIEFAGYHQSDDGGLCTEGFPSPTHHAKRIALTRYKRDVKTRMLRSSLRSDVHLVCVSTAQRAACPWMPNLLVIANGVDVDAFLPSHHRRRESVRLGRIAPEKGFHLAIDAARDAGLSVALAGAVFPYATHREYFDWVIAPRLNGPVRFLGPIGPMEKRRLLSGAAALSVPNKGRRDSDRSLPSVRCRSLFGASHDGTIFRLVRAATHERGRRHRSSRRTS